MIVAFVAKAENTWYAKLSSDTLSIGNSLIERCYLWNGGHLKTISLTDKTTGVVNKCHSIRPDLVLLRGVDKGSEGRLETEVIPCNEIHPSYLKVAVTYNHGALQVRREFRIYENAPAIACDTYLKGVMGAVIGDDMTNHADRKNIESTSDMSSKPVTLLLDQLHFEGQHWHAKAVEFWDVTDWNNNLLTERNVITYRKNNYRGNLLMVRNGADGHGFYFLMLKCSTRS